MNGFTGMSDEVMKIDRNGLAQRFGVAIDWTQQNIMPKLEELAIKYVHYKIAIDC